MATSKSIEEKAKAYDEAIKRANEMIKAMTNIGGVAKVDDIQYLFPELNKESEDESIRKKVVDVLKLNIKGAESQMQASRGVDRTFEVYACNKVIAWLEKQGKNNMGISEATKQKLEDNLNKALKKETPESWNKFIGEQKPAWSEEDETVLNNLIYALANDRIGNDRDEYISYLKSLKERYTWKPSEEQIDALEDAIADAVSSIQKNMLNSLYQDIKKLKGE